MKILNAGSGHDTHGTHFIDLYPARPEVKKCDLNRDKFPYNDDTFDEVYSEDVFEHLLNHDHFMRECNRVLKPGGKLTIITDNANSWVWAFAGTHLGEYEELSDNEDDRHYALFTDWHLENIFKQYGFKPRRVKFWNYYRSGKVKNFVKRFINFVLLFTTWNYRLVYEKITIQGERVKEL